MIWRNLKDYPNHTERVQVIDAWGDRAFAYCTRNEDGSREWVGIAIYIDEVKTHHFRWCELSPEAPSEAEWEATSENR